MILSYVCIRKCFFQNHLCEEGDTLVLDSDIGDSNPWLIRDKRVVQEQIEMQKSTAFPSSKQNDVLIKDTKTKAPASKAGAKAVNGGKAK